MNKAERRHIQNIKELPCGVCGAAPVNLAHHIIENGTRVSHYATISLCWSCHQHPQLGIHGEKRAWLMTKKTELMVLAETMEKLLR